MDLLKQFNEIAAELKNPDAVASFFGVAKGAIGKFQSGGGNLPIKSWQKLIDKLIQDGRLVFDAEPQPEIQEEEEEEETATLAAPNSVQDAINILVAEAHHLEGDDLRLVIEKSSLAIRSKIALCVPTARGVHITGSNLLSIAGNTRNFRCATLKVERGFTVEDAMNKLAAKVLMDKGIEWAFFMNPEIFLPFGNAEWFRKVTKSPFDNGALGLRAVERMCSNRENKIVGAVYACPQNNGKNATYLDLDATDPELTNLGDKLRENGPQNKLLEVPWVATGAMAVHRSALEKILESNDHSPGQDKMFPFFAPSLDQFGGDRRFGELAKKAGIVARLDLAVHAVPWNTVPIIAGKTKKA